MVTTKSPLAGLVNSHGPGSGARPTAPKLPPKPGGFDPNTFAKGLTAEQRKDFTSLQKNVGGNLNTWGKNAAKGAGKPGADLEAMLQQRYGLKGGGLKVSTPPGKGNLPVAAPVTNATPPATTAPVATTGGNPTTTAGSGGAPTATAGSGAGGGSATMLAGLANAMPPAAGPPVLPETPPGLRSGLGMRQPPPMQSPLAGLRRIY